MRCPGVTLIFGSFEIGAGAWRLTRLWILFRVGSCCDRSRQNPCPDSRGQRPASSQHSADGALQRKSSGCLGRLSRPGTAKTRAQCSLGDTGPHHRDPADSCDGKDSGCLSRHRTGDSCAVCSSGTNLQGRCFSSPRLATRWEGNRLSATRGRRSCTDGSERAGTQAACAERSGKRRADVFGQHR
jgi:hypothetical protein